MHTSGPVFGAYASGATTFPAGQQTKVLFATEEFDSHAAFASSRFTAPIAGYYQINAAVFVNANVTSGLTSIYKNGAQFKVGAYQSGTEANPILIVSSLIYLAVNDYVEIFYFNGGASSVSSVATQTQTYFNGCLVSPA